MTLLRPESGRSQEAYRIHPWVWASLLGSATLLVLVLLLSNLQFGLVAPGLLNPLGFRVLPEVWQVNEDWPELLAPSAIALGVVLGVRVLPRRAWAYLLASLLLAGFALRYFLWRSTTLNTAHPFSFACSLAFFLFEGTYLLSTTFQFYPALRFDPSRRRRQADALQAWASEQSPSVDIFIPTYDEAPRLVRRAVLACRNLDYEHKRVIVLDDGHRPEVAQLAAELGVDYLSRPDNAHRKAGNLNHALAHSDGELVAIFDCDFVPFRQFLNRTVGFFRDPQVALVQTPQHFFNADFHNRNLGLEFLMPGDMDYFFHYIQVLRDRFNAVICCGTSYVVRRQALESVGGYFHRCIVEDYQTGTRLLTQRWRLVYLDEILSLGEVPRTFRDYLDQRLRWMQGNLQIYFCGRELPIWSRLDVWQKSFYFNLWLYCFTPLFRVGYILLPLASLILGFSLIAAPPAEYIVYGIPFLILLYGIPAWLTDRHYFQFWAEVYESLFCFPALVCLGQVLVKPFRIIGRLVTVKERVAEQQRLDLALAWPFVVYLLLLLSALAARYGLPLLTPSWLRSPFEGEGIMVTWTLYNGLLMLVCLLACIDQPVRRECDRFPLATVACLRAEGQVWWGVTSDVSEQGAALLLTDRVPPLTIGSGELEFPQVPLTLPVTLVRQGSRDGYPLLGLQFNLADAEREAALIRLLYNDAAWFQKLRRVGSLDAFLSLLGSLWRADPLVRRY